LQRLCAIALLSVTTVALVPLGATAATRGTIAGRIEDGATGNFVAGVRVTLTQAAPDGSGTKETVKVTDGLGRFRFPGLPTGNTLIYVLDAEHDGGSFAGGAVQLPADTAKPPVIRTTLRVWDTTVDPEVIQLSRDDIFVVQEGNNVAVIESVTVVNHSTKAYIGRGGDDGGEGPVPSLGFALPQAVQRNAATGQPVVRIENSDIDVPQVIATEYGFAATTAIPPGETKTMFSYLVTGDGGSFDLSRTALYPTSIFQIFAAPPLDIRSNRLEEMEPTVVGDTEYARHTATSTIGGSDPIQILAVADAGTPGGLIAGAITAVAIITIGAALAYLMAKRRKGNARMAALQPTSQRELALQAIAELDIAHERGYIDDEAWAAQRARLKASALDEGNP
jgi:hypothetical protein